MDEIILASLVYLPSPPLTSVATLTVPSSSSCPSLSRLSTVMVNSVWERLLRSFMLVSPIDLFSDEKCKNSHQFTIGQYQLIEHQLHVH